MKSLVALAIVAVTLGACADPRNTRMAEGALIGGTSGAIIGGIATKNPGGALVGGVIGATAGAVIADATRPHHARKHCHYSEVLEKRVCHYED